MAEFSMFLDVQWSNLEYLHSADAGGQFLAGAVSLILTAAASGWLL